MPSSSRQIRVRDLELNYLEAGSGDRPFVLVHGYTGSSDDFLEQIEPLADLGRTIAIDQRGHGDTTNSGRPDDYTLDNLAADFDAALTELGIDECDLLGHSLGGMVMLRFVLAHPERVRSLILMDTAASGLGFKMPGRKKLEKFVRAKGPVAMADGMRANAAKDKHRPATVIATEERMGADVFWGRIRAKLDRMDPEAFCMLGRLIEDQPSVEERLGEIGCPTTILVGEFDAPFLARADVLANGIPGSTKIVIPDAAHSPQFENEAAWRIAVREHLAAVRSE